VRFAARRRKNSALVEYANRTCAQHVESKSKGFASIVKSQYARFVVSSCPLEHVTHAVNWSVKTMELRSMSPHYVTSVGRVTNE
jgi:hypothetical protein